MRRPALAALPLLIGLAGLGACGGKAGGAAPSPVDGSSAEAPVLFAASRDGSYFVVAAHADTGDVSAYGPALPVDAGEMDWENLHISSDGKRGAAVFTAKSGTASGNSPEDVLLFGDGSTWTTIDHAARVQLLDTSDDLSLVAVAHLCPDPSSGEFPLVLRNDGTVLFQDDTCAPGTPATVAALAPDGSYFVTSDQNGGLTLHQTNGHNVVLNYGPPSETVLRAFPTSVLLGGGELGEQWVDTEGKPIDVPGWPSTGAGIGPKLVWPSNGPPTLVVSGGVIYGLEDRALNRLADVPPGVDPAAVVDVRGNFVIASMPVLQWKVVDAQGSVVSTYTPKSASSAPPTNPSGTPELNPAQWTMSTSKNDAWYLFWNEYETMTATQAVVYESADDLWLFVDRGGTPVSRTLELRRSAVLPGAQDDSGRDRDYVSSSTGAFLLYEDGGVLHTVDVDSGVDRTLATDFAIDSVRGSIFRHNG
jgi:hypothetical protein